MHPRATWTHRSEPTTSAACSARLPSTDACRLTRRRIVGELRAVEDEAIAVAVGKLEATGMRAATDGEYRRGWFHLDFLQQLDGVAVSGNIAVLDAAESVHMTPPRLTVVGKLRHTHPIQVPDFR